MNKDKVTCAICGNVLKRITHLHLKKHDISVAEYKIKYPNAKIISDNKRQEMSGVNSPYWKGGEVNVVCIVCGNCVTVPKHKEKRRKFCSRECMGIYNSKYRIGDNSIRWIENKPMIVCENCGKKFEVIPSKEKIRRFCSKRCEGEFKVGDNNPFYGKHHTLETLELIVKNRIVLKKEKSPNWINRVIKICEMCGDEYEVERRSVDKSHFCSKQCKADYDSINSKGVNNPNWKGGITKERQGLYSSREWKELTQIVFKRDHYQCQKCRTTGRQYNKLHVHHIISFENINTRDDVDNLVLLCHKCHSWVHSKKNINGDFIDE
jgi:5-methylcytosine-specific restriction endonuclease McrA